MTDLPTSFEENRSVSAPGVVEHPCHRRVVRGVAILLLAALAVLSYARALHNPLLHDDRTLLDNAWLAREASVVDLFRHDYWFGTRHAGSDLYRPLTILTFMWNLRATRGALPFHAVNLGLHAAVTLMLAWMLLAVARRLGTFARHGPERSSPEPIGNRDVEPAAAAAAGAALFAVHPLASESVLLAVGRAELLAALFGLAAFTLVVTGRHPSPLRAAGSSVLLGLALLSKESAASWLVILFVWWVVALGAGDRQAGTGRALLGWLAVAGSFAVLRGSVVGWLPQRPPWVDNPLVLWGPWTRLANAVRLQALYLARMVFPARLSLDYGYHETRVVALLPWGLVAALGVALAGIGVAVVLRRSSPAALFLWIFVPAAFAVTGNFFFPIGTIFAERLAYLPLAGACGTAGWWIARWARGRVRMAAVLPPLLLALGARTVVRCGDFRDLATLVEATAAASPRSVTALANLGRTRLRLGEPARALAPLETAVLLYPDYVRALRLLAQADERLGRLEEAQAWRRRAEQAAERARTGDAWTPRGGGP